MDNIYQMRYISNMAYKKLDIKHVQKAAGVLKSIAHPVRLRIIETLAQSKDCSVTKLCAQLKEEQAIVSKHLANLKRAGLVESRTDCNFRYYFIKNRNILNILDCIRKTCAKGE